MSNSIDAGMIYRIARHEFAGVLKHPLVPVVGLIVLIVACLTSAGGVADLQKLEPISLKMGEDTMIVGFGLSWQPVSMICTIMAVFLGATMIPYERWGHSLNVLLSKPVRRRDFLLGKLLGLSAFMLLFNACALLLVSLTLIIFYRGPHSGTEFIWRLIAYILALSLTCSLVIALNMLFGIVSRNILFVTAASILYVFFDWIWYNDRILGSGPFSLISPVNLYNQFINSVRGPFTSALFDIRVSPGEWFAAVMPLLILYLVEMFVLLYVEDRLFAREDTI